MIEYIAPRVFINPFAIPVTDFKRLLDDHQKAYPDTPKVEALGKALTAASSAAQIEDFVRSVCKWGGYAGIGGRVIKNNTTASLQGVFQATLGHVARGEVGGALDEVTKLNGLDTSFGSKHLRFLRPDEFPVLDSVLSGRLGYEQSRKGYEKFCDDLRKMRPYLPDAGKVWRLADIEAAIFMGVQAE